MQNAPLVVGVGAWPAFSRLLEIVYVVVRRAFEVRNYEPDDSSGAKDPETFIHKEVSCAFGEMFKKVGMVDDIEMVFGKRNSLGKIVRNYIVAS